jgi:choice-of-anchor A domain-containing protein
MRLTMFCAALVVAFSALVAPAYASILGVAGDFNGFVFGNLSATGGDTEGRLAVGGNMFAEFYSVASGGIGPAVPYVSPPNDHLVVGGNLDAPGNWQVFNGNAVYGGTLIADPDTICASCSTKPGNPVDFGAVQADLLAKSAYWASLPTNASMLHEYSTLTLTATNAGLNVFNVPESLWESTNTKLIVNPNPNATLLINILGTNISQSGGLFYNGTQTPSTAHGKVLFNYADATLLNIANMGVLGSVLAPKAHLALTSGGINGVGIAASAQQTWGGEFHNFTFTGDLPNSTPAPEPTTAMIFAVGALCGLGVYRRRDC